MSDTEQDSPTDATVEPISLVQYSNAPKVRLPGGAVSRGSVARFLRPYLEMQAGTTNQDGAAPASSQALLCLH
eukprot:3436659-Prorocentrum_lima.AAC.1